MCLSSGLGNILINFEIGFGRLHLTANPILHKHFITISNVSKNLKYLNVFKSFKHFQTLSTFSNKSKMLVIFYVGYCYS